MKDYLSKLPRDILSKITSMLDIKDAAKTSILSKGWRYIWINRPDFTFNDFNVVWLKFDPVEKIWAHRDIPFVKVVDQVMQQRIKSSNPIKCFRLQFDLGKKFYPHIDHWIRYAIRDGLETLDLDLTSYSFEPFERYEFSLPRTISENQGSLKHIRLVFCSIECESSLQKLDSLVSLELRSVTISNSQLTKVLECCPALEELILCRCSTLDKLRIDCGNNNLLKSLSLKGLKLSEIDFLHSQCQSSLQKLDSLVSLQLESVNISNSQLTKILKCCPSLEKLILCRCSALYKLSIDARIHTHMKFLSLKYLSISEIDLGTNNLIFLELENVGITRFELKRFIKGCASLEKLSLHNCPRLTNLKICDAHITMLSLKRCSALNEIDLCMSNLRTFEYDGQARFISFNIKAPRLVNALILERNDVQFPVTKSCLDIPTLENLVSLMIDLPSIFKFQEDSQPKCFNVRHLFLFHYSDFYYRPSSLINFIFKCFPSLQTLGLNITENIFNEDSHLKEEIKIQVPEKCLNRTITMLELNGFFESPYHVDLLKYLFENLTALEVLAVVPSRKIPQTSHDWAHSRGNIRPGRLLQDKDQWLRAIIPPRFL